MTKIRYSIIRLDVKEYGEVVVISHKLPAHLKTCTGFIARHTKGIEAPKDLEEIGLLALEFNNRKNLHINAIVGFQKNIEELPEYQDILMPLENGQLVTGYYMDTKMILPVEFKPYSISIYLRCELENTTTEIICTTT